MYYNHTAYLHSTCKLETLLPLEVTVFLVFFKLEPYIQKDFTEQRVCVGTKFSNLTAQVNPKNRNKNKRSVLKGIKYQQHTNIKKTCLIKRCHFVILPIKVLLSRFSHISFDHCSRTSCLTIFQQTQSNIIQSNLVGICVHLMNGKSPLFTLLSGLVWSPLTPARCSAFFTS